MNSPTMAPATARMAPTFMPEKMYGSDPGSWILRNSVQREPRSDLTRSSKSGSTSLKPRAVVSRIGKKQMLKAIRMFGKMPYENHTMNSGPNATFGIMFSVTNSGSSNKLTSGDQVNITASITPTTAPRQNPPRISAAVTARFESQAYLADVRVASAASGEGRMNFGTAKMSTRICQST